MKKIWVNKPNSFKTAEKFDIDYYLTMSSSKRLGTVQFLREVYSKFKKGLKNENRKRLRRVVKIIK
jgi:hypothetical protein